MCVCVRTPQLSIPLSSRISWFLAQSEGQKGRGKRPYALSLELHASTRVLSYPWFYLITLVCSNCPIVNPHLMGL